MFDYIIGKDGELYHYGVKGQKWGVRRYQNKDGSLTSDGQKKKLAFTQSDGYRNTLRKVMSNKTINKAANNLTELNMERARQKEAKKERKQQLKSTYKNLKDKAGLGERLLYTSGTRRKAAKYIVDNNMSVEEATRRSKGEARRNTAILLGVYGAIAVGSFMAQNR